MYADCLANTSEAIPRKSTVCFDAAFIGCALVTKRVSLPWFGKTSEVTPMSLPGFTALDQNDYFPHLFIYF